MHPRSVEAPFDPRADARNRAQREIGQRIGQARHRQRHQPVGFLKVAGELGEHRARRQSDRAAQRGTDAFGNAALNLARLRLGERNRIFLAAQPAQAFVDRMDARDGQMPSDFFHQRQMQFDIAVVPRRTDRDAGAEASRLDHRRAARDT